MWIFHASLGDVSTMPQLGWYGGREHPTSTYSLVLESASQCVVLWAGEFIQG